MLFEAIRKGASIEEINASSEHRPLVSAPVRRAGAELERAIEPGHERVFRAVDTCGGEFEAATPYFYSGYERVGPDGPQHEIERGDNAERDDPRLRPEPRRPGHRVRLLLRARGDDGSRDSAATP